MIGKDNPINQTAAKINSKNLTTLTCLIKR
jgi:hypothetical protein